MESVITVPWEMWAGASWAKGLVIMGRQYWVDANKREPEISKDWSRSRVVARRTKLLLLIAA